MSDYYGRADLGDWLAEEVFCVNSVPDDVVKLFEQWRVDVEANIQAWQDSDDGDGCASWRGWGRGFNAISDADDKMFESYIDAAKLTMSKNADA